ncbi:MAG: PASTA domain-containing protein [Bacteroidales bacterium]|nr:PASTA domain-containing protein [Bacteroidales bacterium]
MKNNGFIQKHPIVRHLLWMLGLSVGILIVVMLFVKIYSRHGQEYVMENYAGENYKDVVKANSLGLRFVVTDSIYNEEYESGTILSQDPPAGALIKKGRKVYLTIASSEPEDVLMPDLVDMSLRQAVSQLMSEGLTIGKLTFVESEDRNAILAQKIKGHTVAPGQKISRGSVVDLTVGKGTSEVGTIIPVLIGKNREGVQRAVFASSLNISETFNSGVTNKATAKAYKQEPICSDVKYPLGTIVRVWYCNANEYESQRRSADQELDSLKRVADSLRRELDMVGDEDDGLDFDYLDMDDLW